MSCLYHPYPFFQHPQDTLPQSDNGGDPQIVLHHHTLTELNVVQGKLCTFIHNNESWEEVPCPQRIVGRGLYRKDIAASGLHKVWAPATSLSAPLFWSEIRAWGSPAMSGSLSHLLWFSELGAILSELSQPTVFIWMGRELASTQDSTLVWSPCTVKTELVQCDGRTCPQGMVFSVRDWITAHLLPANPALFDGPNAEAQCATTELLLYLTTLGESGQVSCKKISTGLASVPRDLIPAPNCCAEFLPGTTKEQWQFATTIRRVAYFSASFHSFESEAVLSAALQTCTSKEEYVPLSTSDSLLARKLLSEKPRDLNPAKNWLASYLGEAGVSQTEVFKILFLNNFLSGSWE
ncbi:hypothetical protein K438DRAFT_1760148 [Mycena galopus ATCC 62051]|nr:hypothetical protein K438DRAFT_1760148 [Mycena galopus ATCC 62051]